jgi:hypothetical protein
MNIYTTIVSLFSLVCFVALGASCQTRKGNTQEIYEKAVTPAPTQEIDKVVMPAPTRTKFRNRDDSKRLKNDAGWELPNLSLFKEVSKEEYKAKNSIAKIEQKNYAPLSDVIQFADGNTYFDVDRDPDMENKAWLIKRMKVFSAQGQPFCYVMRGNGVGVDANGKIIGRLAVTIVLVYTDQDGDGRFETFQYTAGEAPVIPERLIKH